MDRITLNRLIKAREEVAISLRKVGKPGLANSYISGRYDSDLGDPDSALAVAFANTSGKRNCPSCDGLGEWDVGPLPARSSVQISPEYKRVICPDCEGKGWFMSDWVPA